ncbi:glycosyltransferase [Actinopolymorpha sp. B17G11]|uniref:glycosyltransferase n=1 Tax=unclassified Actinopolymorpha TaxID=2627063 RepID=UPI0032D94BC8
MHLLAMVGTDYHPFDRLVRWVDAWSIGHPEVECLIQYGTAPAPRHAAGVAYAEHDELGEWMDRAGIVVCHAGPSTILEVRRRGLLPIVVPRCGQSGEHVDDHQERFASRLAGTGLVLTAGSQRELGVLLDKALDDPTVVRLSEVADGAVTDAAVRRFGELVSGLFSPVRTGKRR